MIKLKVSQTYLSWFTGLTNEDKEKIDEEIANANRFIKAGNRIFPVVDFEIEDDMFNSDKVEGSTYDGLASYGVLPNGEGQYDKIMVMSKKQIGKKPELAKEQPLMTLDKFNLYANKEFDLRMKKYAYEDWDSVFEPKVKATHRIEFPRQDIIFNFFPTLGSNLAKAMHYLFNELNSNRRVKRFEDDEIYYERVVRFTNMKNEIEYYVLVDDKTSDINILHKFYLFEKVDKPEIVYVDLNENEIAE